MSSWSVTEDERGGNLSAPATKTPAERRRAAIRAKARARAAVLVSAAKPRTKRAKAAAANPKPSQAKKKKAAPKQKTPRKVQEITLSGLRAAAVASKKKCERRQCKLTNLKGKTRAQLEAYVSNSQYTSLNMAKRLTVQIRKKANASARARAMRKRAGLG